MNGTILTLVPLEERHREQMQKLCPEAKIVSLTGASQATDEQLVEAEIIFGNPEPARLAICRKLKFLQLESAGYDNYIAPGVLPEGVRVANATGAYGVALAEHMLAGVLAVQKNLYFYMDRQREGDWSDGGDVGGIYGSRAVIIGAGDIGSQMALRLSAMGASVAGVKRTVRGSMEYFDDLYEFRTAPWEQLLGDADMVIITAPLTEDTYHLIDGKKLAMMKPEAILVNGGRGGIVDTEALCDALEQGKLHAAVLDVTDPEPLPKDHRLWTTRGACITPHVAGGHHFRETVERIISIGTENMGHYAAGEPLRNQIR